MSDLIILSANKALGDQLSDWVSPHGWRSTVLPDASPIYSLGEIVPALFIVDHDEGGGRWQRWVADIRDRTGPVAGTPILLMADAATPLAPGVSAILPVPLDRETALATIRCWAGPLDDHGFRDLANPHYRLVRLGGRTVADGLIARFIDHLDRALAWLDDPVPGSPVPHQVAGLAGMIGYDEISRIWRAIDAGDSFDAAALRARIDAAIDRMRGDIARG